MSSLKKWRPAHICTGFYHHMLRQIKASKPPIILDAGCFRLSCRCFYGNLLIMSAKTKPKPQLDSHTQTFNVTSKHSGPAQQRLGSGSVCGRGRCRTSDPLCCRPPTAYQRPRASVRHRRLLSQIFHIYSFIHSLNIHRFRTFPTIISRQ